MKKYLRFPVIIMLSLSSIAFVTGCGNDDDDAPQISCEQAQLNVTTAASTYLFNQASRTKANCEAYEAAYQQVLNSCVNNYTAQQKADVQRFIDELNCNALL